MTESKIIDKTINGVSLNFKEITKVDIEDGSVDVTVGMIHI